MLLTMMLTAGCAFDSGGFQEAQPADDSAGMMDDGETGADESETSDEDSGSSDDETGGETGSTGGDGGGDGDGDDGGTEPTPVEPYMPCDPIEMMAGDNYCADGPRNINDPDSPLTTYTCVLGTVSPGPGMDPVGGMYCLPMFDVSNDGTDLHNGCFEPGGGNRQFAGCFNLACVSSDQLPFDFCQNNDMLNPFPGENWDSHCCTAYCDTDAGCAPGLTCQMFGTTGACMEG